MTPVVLKASANLPTNELDSISPVARPIGEPVSIMRSKVAFKSSSDSTSAGIWECSPGKWRRQVAEAEFSTFLSGRCTFTPDCGPTIVLEAGDSIYFHPNTNGEWKIIETVRKAFVILPTAHQPV
ncbi:cupin domain-containing protein [Bradyrhizobium sp. WSM471]|uniref:cupin domain-containing protein n=1 Tax=Bradyrhizobium sp. WSM471 TaxID=319017 RepID=UPI00024D1D27|nr:MULTISPECIES: cupin domain-containing protein [Bradyrhizobium]EHR01017.1 putative enzyme of the cupin superfamily [Bradyrhizobium sp. WSM471]UFW43075.1 cupin domain-containing protein [Bradyrhizobium canariense]